MPSTTFEWIEKLGMTIEDEAASVFVQVNKGETAKGGVHGVLLEDKPKTHLPKDRVFTFSRLVEPIQEFVVGNIEEKLGSPRFRLAYKIFVGEACDLIYRCVRHGADGFSFDTPKKYTPVLAMESVPTPLVMRC